jgi:hypothetical protein
MERMETKIPAAPTPAKARPKIRTSDEGATPQMRDPISNRVCMRLRAKGQSSSPTTTLEKQRVTYDRNEEDPFGRENG